MRRLVVVHLAGICISFAGADERAFTLPSARFAELTPASREWISARSCAMVAAKDTSYACWIQAVSRKLTHYPRGLGR